MSEDALQSLEKRFRALNVDGESTTMSRAEPSDAPEQELQDAREIGESYVVPIDQGLSFASIVGHETVIEKLKASILLRCQFPQLFTSEPSNTKGVLLYGPNGCGKKLLAMTTCAEVQALCFVLSPSLATCTSIRSVFDAARKSERPVVILVENVDELCGSNTTDQGRRLKTEFLVQVMGIGKRTAGPFFVVGLSENPWQIEGAIRRRSWKNRFYVAMPTLKERIQLLDMAILANSESRFVLADDERAQIAAKCERFSGQQIVDLVRLAARSIPTSDSVRFSDLARAMQEITPAGLDEIDQFDVYARDFETGT